MIPQLSATETAEATKNERLRREFKKTNHIFEERNNKLKTGKIVTSILLAVILALALAVPAMAADWPNFGNAASSSGSQVYYLK